MKYLSKLMGFILFVTVLSVNIDANAIDECKSDLYFANGIMMKYSSEKAGIMWKKQSRKLILDPKISSKIDKVIISYNRKQGILDDMLESFEQIMSNEWGWKEFSLYFAVYLQEKGIQEDIIPHVEDLVKQVKQYKESINLGHNVIVVAHSQGNYYTNEAYDMLDDWMKPYFHMMGVATPADHVAGDGPYVKFYNDFIKFVVTGLPANRTDPNPKHNQTFSIEAHDFYASYLAAENTRNDIINFIEEKVINHEKAPSQWETDQEFERNTCNYRITVKHRFDPSIEMGEKVYPFAANKKLYQVNGEWVKASCGGTHILDQWDGKKDNECSMIDNVEKEKIVKNTLNIVKFYAKYYYTNPESVYNSSNGHRARVTLYTNPAFKVLTKCDGSGHGMVSSWNYLKSNTPEQYRYEFIEAYGPERVLQCNLNKVGKMVSEVKYIKMTAKKTELKHDTRPYLAYPDYFETKIEYTVYIE